MIGSPLRGRLAASLAIAALGAAASGCATGVSFDQDADADTSVDMADTGIDLAPDSGDTAIDDIAIDDIAIDDVAVDDVMVDDVMVDDVVADDVTIDDVITDDFAVDDLAIDDMAIDDVTIDDVAVDDVIVDDVVVDDVAVDDVAVDDTPPTCTIFGTDTFGYQGCESRPAVLGCDDIGATGTFLTSGDDEYGRTSIGFSFDFYGTAYTDASVGTNGHVYFTDAYLGLGSVCLPGDPGYSGIVTFIAGFWCDLYQDSSMGRGVWVQTLGTAPDRRFVAQWHSDFCCSTLDDGILFQIVLFEGSNDIRVCYVDTRNGSSYDDGAYSTAGIQSSTSLALEYSCDAASLTAGLQLDYLHP